MKSTLLFKRLTNVLLFAMFILACVNDIHAQQTTLTVDCQTPGWLSNKIGYKDQLSVKNLTVTGYLNLTDMSFLAGLTKNNLIHLDMSGVEMIEKPNNVYKGNKFAEKLQYLSLPNNDNNLKFYALGKVDSVFVNAEGILEMNELGSKAKYLHIGEGVDSICVNDARCSGFKKVHLPSGVHCLGRGFYYESYAYHEIVDTLDINLENLSVIEGMSIQAYVKSDTIKFSGNLKKWKTNAFGIKNGAVLYLPAGLEYIDDNYDFSAYEMKNQIDGRPLEFYCKMQLPPKVTKSLYSTNFKNCIVHVPIGCSEIYKNTDPWSKATIIEEHIAVTGIELAPSSINFSEIGESVQLIANVFPNDATNKNVIWNSSNTSVAVVSKGKVICVGYGTAVIFAITEDGAFMATCVINVTSGIECVETNNNVTIKDETIILTNLNKGSLIRLTDLSGKTIYEKKLQDGGAFTTPRFVKGMYILSVGSQNYKLAIP